MIYVHPLTLNYPLQYPKRLSNIIDSKQQLCIQILYESLVGQREYTTQPKGSFWCHVIDTKVEILIGILLNKFILVLFHTHLGMR